MRSKLINLIDYVINILAIQVSVYFISSLIHKNKHVSIPIDALMWGMVFFIIIDCLLYIYSGYQENIVATKIMRGFVWAIAVCTCDLKGALVLFIIALSFGIFISQPKRRTIDIPCSFLVFCITMECVSIIGILFDGEYQSVGNLLNNSLMIDILLIISVVIYIYSDKVTEIIAKIPSIEKDREIEIRNAEQVLEIDKKAIYVCIALVGVILGLHLYSSFFMNIVAINILISSLAIMIQIGILYAIYDEVFIDFEKIYKLLIAIGTVCLPYINYNNYDINKSLVYLFVFALLLCILKLLSKYKFKWAIAVAIIVVQTVLLFMQGVYIIPLINVLVGILLGKIIQKNYYIVVIICVFFIVSSQIVIEKQYISYEKKYHDLSELCIKLENYSGIPVYYMGNNSDFVQAMEKEGVMLENAELKSDNSIEIYEASVENEKIYGKYCLYLDDRYIIVTDDVNTAEEYKNDGGDYNRIAPETKIITKNGNKKIDFTISDVPEDYHDVTVAVWCDTEKQKDLEWIPLSNSKEGVYTCDIDKSKHKKGDIIMHVYASYKNDPPEIIGNTVVSAKEE